MCSLAKINSLRKYPLYGNIYIIVCNIYIGALVHMEITLGIHACNLINKLTSQNHRYTIYFLSNVFNKWYTTDVHVHIAAQFLV